MRFTMFNVMHGLGWVFSISGRYGCCCYDAFRRMETVMIMMDSEQCHGLVHVHLRRVKKIQSDRRSKELCPLRAT
jgi:hypothetical protein